MAPDEALLLRDDVAFDVRLQRGHLSGTSHPSQCAPGLPDGFWRTLSPHTKSPAPRRPLDGARAGLVQDAIQALARAWQIEPYGATAFVAARLRATKPAVRLWALEGRGARRFVPAVADLVEQVELDCRKGSKNGKAGSHVAA